MSTARMSLGRRGEEIAAQYLQQHGYVILATNWHCQAGEIDIIAREGATLVFVEVKTRRTASTGDTFAAITPEKRRRLTRAVYTYLDVQASTDSLWRIDAIAVALSDTEKPVINHVQDALDW